MDHQLKTISIYNQYVEEYSKKFMSFDLYNDTFDDFLELLPGQSHLIELGCGPGNVIAYFLNKKPDLTILGIDLAPEMLRKASIVNPSADFRQLDIRALTILDQKFDAVVGAFCLPYLSYSDLNKFFLDLNHLTAVNGFLYLSCMEGATSQSGFEKTSFTGNDEIYIYYHQREKLESLMQENGFELVKRYTKDYPEADGSTTTDLVYIAQKIATP